jgi:hypothetical protein
VNEESKRTALLKECLLADYHAVKVEIARRANLQRAAVGAYLVVSALIVKASSEANGSGALLPILWLLSPVVLLFYSNEGREIRHLGNLVKQVIGPEMGQLTGRDASRLFPSEINDGGTDRRLRQLHTKILAAVIFLGIPVVATAATLAVWFQNAEVAIARISLVHLVAVSVSVLGAVCIVFVLSRELYRWQEER